MATLTGNSISSTYTSLLKVGDNGTLASALQAITDGAGNGSGLSMNTSGDLTATGTVTANAFAGALTGNVTGNLTGTASLASNLTGTPNISVGTITASGTITGNVTGNITGNLTGNVTGNVSGTSGSTTGNAATATALANARTIAGVSFDGTANISLDTDDISEATNKYYTNERVDDQVNTLLQAGTGITKTYNDAGGTLTIINNAPDQTVALTAGTSISVSGTYPNFTITNAAPDQTVSLTGGTGIGISGTYPNFTIANTGSGISLSDLSATDAGGLGSFSYNNSSGVFTYTGASNSDVRGLISVTDAGGDGSLAYNNSTGVITYTGASASDVQAHITKSYVDGLGIAASTATTLETARNINGVSFNGSANITLDTDDIGEGSSNLYYTTARFTTAFGTKTTANLTEGSNLYFTDERVDDRVANLVVAGASISKTYDDSAGTLTIANTAPDQTVALTAGSNISVSGTYPNFTIAATDTQTDSFKTISVSGQSDVVADSATDTLTLAAGSNMTLTTAAGSDTITFAATDTNTTYSAGTGLALGGTTFSLNAGLNNLTDTTITSPAAGHVLIYDNTNSIFENALLTAGSNITITNADGAITIAATNTNTDSFKTISVSGQDNLVADSATDTLTIAAGSNVTLTTTAASDTLTIAATDTNTTYTAGSGLTLSGTEFSLTNNAVTIGGTSVALGAALTATSGALTIGGNGSSGGVTINDGSLQMRTGTGNVAEIRMYCETGNAHYQTIKAAPHSASSSAVLTLPTATGTFVATGDTGSVASGMIAADAVTQAKIADDAVGADQLAASAVVTASIVDSNVTTAKIADNNITYAKLGVEFTEAAALSGTSVDWATATTFTKTLSANTTLTFANVSTGMQINLVISGNYTLTLPASVKELTNASTYDGSGENLISIVSTNGNTEQFATINKVA